MTESQIWSWKALFLKIESFLGSSGHQLGQCSVNYRTHTLEGFEFYMSSLVHLKNLLDANIMINIDQVLMKSMNVLDGQITQLISCLTEIIG